MAKDGVLSHKRNGLRIFKDYQLYHIYIREHEGLNGKTPAEAANIHIEGANKWLTIIQNASHVQSLNSEKDVQQS